MGIVCRVLLSADQRFRRLAARRPEIYELSEDFRIAGIHAKRALKLLLCLAPLVGRRSGLCQRKGYLWISRQQLLGN